MPGVPYTFGNATTAIPLSNLDADFNTTATLGNAAIGLGNTTTTVGNLTLGNVLITSVATTFPNSFLANSTATLGNATLTLGSSTTAVGNLALNNATIENIQEPANITATAANATINIDILSNVVVYCTANATGNFTVNFRGNAGTTFNNAVPANVSVSASLVTAQGATAYYNSLVQVDGATVTPKWQGGTAPTTGNANSTDTYVYVVMKSAANTYTILASQTKFA
tara:strand:- start:14660 stop:15337 length:678 start_codon:yes stop_codon:yes gene_type:complete